MRPQQGTSKYYGVSWDKKKKKWHAKRKYGKKIQKGGYFDDELEAAKVSDALLRQHGKTQFHVFNFPTDEEKAAHEKLRKNSRSKRPRVKSNYIGVFYMTSSKQWRPKRKLNGVVFHGDFYDNEKDAAYASDEIARNHGGSGLKYNFDGPNPNKKPKKTVKPAKKTYNTKSKAEKEESKKEGKETEKKGDKRPREHVRSKYIGVTYKPRTGLWQARRKITGKTYRGDAVASELLAARQSDALVRQYGGSHGKLNFPEETSFIPVGQGLGAATLAISQTKPIGQEPQFNSDFMISDEEKSDSEEESDERWIPSGGARLGSPTKKRKLNPRRTIRKITSEIKVKKENENGEDEDDAPIFFEQTLTQMNASRQRIIENQRQRESTPSIGSDRSSIASVSPTNSLSIESCTMHDLLRHIYDIRENNKKLQRRTTKLEKDMEKVQCTNSELQEQNVNLRNQIIDLRSNMQNEDTPMKFDPNPSSDPASDVEKMETETSL